MDGVCGGAVGEERKLIMCLGATNRPWDLDEALIRRLERRICTGAYQIRHSSAERNWTQGNVQDQPKQHDPGLD